MRLLKERTHANVGLQKSKIKGKDEVQIRSET